jgi:hypothetical protein
VREVLARRSRRPSLAPGLYLRLPLVGYLGGIDSKRGIALARGGLHSKADGRQRPQGIAALKDKIGRTRWGVLNQI